LGIRISPWPAGQFDMFMTYHRVCNYINTMGVTSGAGTAYPSRAPELTPGF